jgi:hypothetical protein
MTPPIWPGDRPAGGGGDAAMVRAVAATDAELHFLPASQAEAGQV